jgi:hypothetical protein
MEFVILQLMEQPIIFLMNHKIIPYVVQVKRIIIHTPNEVDGLGIVLVSILEQLQLVLQVMYIVGMETLLIQNSVTMEIY